MGNRRALKTCRVPTHDGFTQEMNILGNAMVRPLACSTVYRLRMSWVYYSCQLTRSNQVLLLRETWRLIVGRKGWRSLFLARDIAGWDNEAELAIWGWHDVISPLRDVCVLSLLDFFMLRHGNSRSLS